MRAGYSTTRVPPSGTRRRASGSPLTAWCRANMSRSGMRMERLTPSRSFPSSRRRDGQGRRAAEGERFGPARSAGALRLVKAGSLERRMIAKSQSRLDLSGPPPFRKHWRSPWRDHIFPSLFGRGDETLGSLFRDVEKVFEEFS